MTRASTSTLTDDRGLRLGTTSRLAADQADAALWQMMTQADSPRLALQAAREADPGWVLPSLLDAGFRLALLQADDLAAARRILHECQPLAAHAAPREQAHLRALLCLQDGHVEAALRIWDELLLQHPRDALALHWLHPWAALRGDAENLRRRPARALPEWDDADPLFPSVLALYAFGLAEGQQYALAEELGRRALTLAKVPWAVHAVTHAMEMQGRFDEGAAWLRQQQAGWAEGTRFATHLWWHLALFRLESMDVAGTLRLIDTHLSGATLSHALQCVDAASLYWRLRNLDVEVDALFKELLRRWQPDPEDAGSLVYIDCHVVLALLGAGERAQAERWVARCAARVMQADDPGRSNHAVARELGLPYMRALLAAERGDHDAAVRGLYLVHEAPARLGGGRVRRDVVAQTLMACASRSTLRHIGRAVLNERCLAKPLTPLTRHWADRLGVVVA